MKKILLVFCLFSFAITASPMVLDKSVPDMEYSVDNVVDDVIMVAHDSISAVTFKEVNYIEFNKVDTIAKSVVLGLSPAELVYVPDRMFKLDSLYGVERTRIALKTNGDNYNLETHNFGERKDYVIRLETMKIVHLEDVTILARGQPLFI